VENMTTTGPSTQGPPAQHEGIPSGKKEMSPLPLRGPLLGTQPLQFVSSGPTLLTLVLALLPKPAYLSSNLDPLLHRYPWV